MAAVSSRRGFAENPASITFQRQVGAFKGALEEVDF